MIKFKELHFKNFLSYGKKLTSIHFDSPGTVLITGENLDISTDGKSANGVGKAQPLDALVKTPTGWIRMGDISVGTEVEVPDGSIAVVDGVFPQGIKDIYEITFADGRVVEACGEHLWKVQSHRWYKRKNSDTPGTKILSTLELKQFVDVSKEKKKAWYNISVPAITPRNKKDITLPINPYLLGALLGDGSLTRNVMFSNTDEEVISTVRHILKEDYNQELVQYGTQIGSADYCIRKNPDTDKKNHNISILKAITDIGLSGTNSYTKFIPKIYLEDASVDQKLQLLKGLLDTDGTIGKTNSISFSSSSHQLAKDVQYLVWSIGGKAKISVHTPYYTNATGDRTQGATNYRVSIEYKDRWKLFSIDRKLDRLTTNNSQYSNAGIRIVDIKYKGKQEAQCIRVDHPDHLYITNGFITTHNTSIINALCFGIYDKTISNISKDNLINNINKKGLMVEVVFSVKGNNYKIRRTRKGGKSGRENSVTIWENNNDITPDSVSNANKLIEDIIGIRYDLFVRIVVFSATNVPFLDLPFNSHYAACQVSIIEDLFDLKTLSQKAIALKEKIKESERSLETELVRIAQLEKEHKRHDEQIEKAQLRIDNWEKERVQTIELLSEKLNQLDEVNIDEERSLHQQISNVDADIQKIVPVLQQKEREYARQRKKQKQLVVELNHLQGDQCPYCLQDYPDADAKINQIQTDLNEAEQFLESCEREIKQLEESFENMTLNKKEISKKIRVSDIGGLLEFYNKSSSMKTKIEELKASTNPFVEPLQELKNAKIDSINYHKVNKLNEKIDHMQFLLKLLTKRDSFVRKTLLNRNIPYLNNKLQHYLTLLGLSHKVKFTHEMTAEISQFGRELDFGNLSAGQRARVNLALSLAFRDVLENMHSKINICLLDEVLDVGLDDVGVQSAARMLKQKAREENLHLYVISHRNEIESTFDKNMIIRLQNGFSQVV